MKLNDLRSIDQLRDFLDGTQAVVFAVVTDKDERWLSSRKRGFGEEYG